MSDNVTGELDGIDAGTMQRAQEEPYTLAILSPGIVAVTNRSYEDSGHDADNPTDGDHTYIVNVMDDGVPFSCGCKAYEFRSGPCKHMVATALAVDDGHLSVEDIDTGVETIIKVDPEDGDKYPAFVRADGDYDEETFRSDAGTLFRVVDDDPDLSRSQEEMCNHDIVKVLRLTDDGSAKRRNGYDGGRYTSVENTTYKCRDCGVESGTGVPYSDCSAVGDDEAEEEDLVADGGTVESTGCPHGDPRCEGVDAEADRPELCFECWESWAAYDEEVLIEAAQSDTIEDSPESEEKPEIEYGERRCAVPTCDQPASTGSQATRSGLCDEHKNESAIVSDGSGTSGGR